MLALDYRPGARGTPAFLPDAELVQRGEELCVRPRRGSVVQGVLRDGIDGRTRIALTTEGEELRVVVPRTLRATTNEPLVSAALPIFTYGTLMRGGPLHGAIAKHAPRITPAHALGRLVHLGDYPGLLPGSDPVHGELVTLHPERALVELDELEDFRGYGAPGSLYRRVVLPVWSEGRAAIAWAYRYLGAVDGAPVIASGDWRRGYGASSALEGGA